MTTEVIWADPAATPPSNVVTLRRRQQQVVATPVEPAEEEVFPEVGIITSPNFTPAEIEAFREAFANHRGEIVDIRVEREIRNAPLLQSPDNRFGHTLTELLHQVHREVGLTHKTDVFMHGVHERKATSVRRKLLAAIYEAEILSRQLDDVSSGTKTRP